jgi:uncharacterized RDD family membrane protein YckC
MENRILVKCPQCGYAISEKKRRCEQCGLPVSAMLKMATPQEQPEPPAPVAVSPEVPDWRREVSEKLKAYGERKRTLLTPPSPIKESEKHSSAGRSRPILMETPEQPTATAMRPVSRPERPAATQPANTSDVSANHLSAPHAEVWNTDFEELRRDLEQETSEQNLFLGRRALSLLIDNTIIIVLCLVLLYLFSYSFSLDIMTFALSYWPSITSVVLLAHCLYYVYFYSTSRQTPGQVFVALEVKDPNSARIDLGKILIRWSVMVGLNLLNLLPVLFNKKYLLSDKLSGTEIRSF